MAQLLGLLSLLSGLWFLVGMPAVVIVLGLRYWRTRESRTGFLTAAGMLVAFYVTANLLWRFGAADWTLSFLETVDAAANSAKYGHPVEHQAEVMVVWLLIASTLAAAAVGAIAAVVQRPRRERRPVVS